VAPFGPVRSSSSSPPLWCSISPASALDDVAVDDQGTVPRISMHRHQRNCYRHSWLRACHPVHRVCSTAGRSAGRSVGQSVSRSQLSPAVIVRLDITDSALCRLGSLPNRAKHWTFRDMRCVASARTRFARNLPVKCGVDNCPCCMFSSG
jgi:hypothetical protein